MMDFVDAFLDIIAEWVDLDHIPMEKMLPKVRNLIELIKAEALQEAENEGTYVHIDNVDEVYEERHA